MVVAIGFMGLLAALSAPIFTSMVRGPAVATRTIQTDRTLWHMLQRLRQDVQGAEALTAGEDPNSSDLLAITRAGAIVLYDFRQEKVVRSIVGGDEGTSWDVPGASVEWRLWPKGGRPAAVEVRTSVTEHMDRVRRAKLSRTHMIFLAGQEGGSRSAGILPATSRPAEGGR